MASFGCSFTYADTFLSSRSTGTSGGATNMPEAGRHDASTNTQAKQWNPVRITPPTRARPQGSHVPRRAAAETLWRENPSGPITFDTHARSKIRILAGGRP